MEPDQPEPVVEDEPLSRNRFPKTQSALDSIPEVHETPSPEPSPAPLPPAPSKMQAVREALAEGVEAPAQIVQWAQDKYGLVIDVATASNYKSTIKNKDKPRTITVKEEHIPSVPSLIEVMGLMEKLRELIRIYGKEQLIEVIQRL